ncbi:MAG: transcription factor IIA subunit alpha [Piccolia ochrophora]|nr:MAG: transcription factor IIA subunit alpha [Piccolia ochrophora]
MSNQLVGTIYQKIISDVIESSQIDFEEGGVDVSTLEELRKVWQEKLSSLNVAQFPWDPAPAPPPAVSTPVVPSNTPTAKAPQPSPPTVSSSTSSSAIPASSSNVGGVQPKTEPRSDPELIGSGVPSNSTNSQPPNPAVNNPQAAAARAAQQIHERFGSRGNNSIEAMQPGLMMPGPRPGAPPQGVSQNPQIPQQAQQGQSNGAKSAQTDGADDPSDDWTALMMKRNANGEKEEIGRVRVDNMIRRHVEEMGHRMEGGGLMLPLSERPSPHRSTIKARHAPRADSSSSSSSSSSKLKRAQYDGPVDLSEDEDQNGGGGGGIKAEDDDDIADEDAINSDLDDPEENLDADQDDDEGMTQIMLCMYDKVQRVKNKWKCVLKDGVLNVNGKEYASPLFISPSPPIVPASVNHGKLTVSALAFYVDTSSTKRRAISNGDGALFTRVGSPHPAFLTIVYTFSSPFRVLQHRSNRARPTNASPYSHSVLSSR